MDESGHGPEDRPEGGPAKATGYQGPGYPTLGERRSHLARLAGWTAAAAAVTATGAGVALLGMRTAGGPRPMRPEPPLPPPPGGESWIEHQPSDEPHPRLMGEMVAPPRQTILEGGEDPGAIPDPNDPRCTTPKPGATGAVLRPHDDDPLRLKGDMAVAVPEPLPPEGNGVVPPPGKGRGSWLQPGEEDPRIRGKIAMPSHVAPPPPRLGGAPPPPQPPHPPMPGGIRPIDPDPHTTVEIPPEVTVEIVGPEGSTSGGTGGSVAPDPFALSAQEGKLRSVYLQGSTQAGKAFTACVRLDPDDEASYQAVIRERKAILTALAPLAEKPDLARKTTAFTLVRGLVPGATIRQAGVLR